MDPRTTRVEEFFFGDDQQKNLEFIKSRDRYWQMLLGEKDREIDGLRASIEIGGYKKEIQLLKEEIVKLEVNNIINKPENQKRNAMGLADVTYHIKSINKTIQDKFIVGVKYRYDRENDKTPIFVIFNNSCGHQCDNQYVLPGNPELNSILQEVHNLPFDVGCHNHCIGDTMSGPRAINCCICEKKS